MKRIKEYKEEDREKKHGFCGTDSETIRRFVEAKYDKGLRE